MPIAAEEARRAYDLLAASLRAENLEWVLGQVASTIAAGKPAPKFLVMPSDTPFAKPTDHDASLFSDFPEHTPRGRGRREERETTEPFSDQDELRILLDAIEQSLAVPAAFTAETFRTLGKSEAAIDEIMFASDREVEPHSHGWDETDSLASEGVRLSELLAEARRSL